MSTSQATLDAQATDRKARLAQLRSLKRKQQPDETPSAGDGSTAARPSASSSDDKDHAAATQYLSGRNYDVATRGPKLGFENAPTEGQATLEQQAAEIASETRQWQAKEDKADKPVDLFTLQPKKPNWDLKRDLTRKLDVLNVRTDNAIARLVRQRIHEQDKAKPDTNDAAADTVMSDAHTSLDGTTLLEGVHLREREEEEDARRTGAVDEEDDEDMTT